ncbi:hypothetical protein ACOJQI_11105 [Bacillus salacetis]|uniref:hypothetical protein n=1 Tax=Bacillus salacetis TaxID=2315464 RepID=UPI003BA26363
MARRYFRVEIHYSIGEHLKGAAFKRFICSEEELPYKVRLVIRSLEEKHKNKSVSIQRIIANNKHDLTDAVLNRFKVTPSTGCIRKIN